MFPIFGANLWCIRFWEFLNKHSLKNWFTFYTKFNRQKWFFIQYFVQSGKSEKPQRRASIKEAPIPHKFRPRNKTVSGESNQSNDSGLTNFAGSRFFSRTYSRNPDVMTPLSSFPSEEWRRLFDRYDYN